MPIRLANILAPVLARLDLAVTPSLFDQPQTLQRAEVNFKLVESPPVLARVADEDARGPRPPLRFLQFLPPALYNLLHSIKGGGYPERVDT